MNVVLLCRVSTNHQDYNRQINELTEFCDKQGWNVCKVFANKVSGAKTIEERTEIQDMITYVRAHDIDKVVVLEISRLGRNTLEALKVIQMLNEEGICLFVKNYNLETIVNGKINPVASLICTRFHLKASLTGWISPRRTATVWTTTPPSSPTP